MSSILGECIFTVTPVYYRRYVDEIFVLFKSRDHLVKFRDYLEKCHPNFEEEKNGKLSFLDAELSQEGNKFTTTLCRKPILSGV